MIYLERTEVKAAHAQVCAMKHWMENTDHRVGQLMGNASLRILTLGEKCLGRAVRTARPGPKPATVSTEIRHTRALGELHWKTCEQHDKHRQGNGDWPGPETLRTLGLQWVPSPH